MFDTILIPLDGSDQDEIALPVAIDQALRQNATLVVLYTAIQPEPCVHWHPYRRHGAPEAEPGTCPDCTVALTYLHDLQQRLHLYAGTEMLMAAGDPVRLISAEAHRRSRPLIVMAATPATDAAITAEDDRAGRLLALGPCPIVLVPSVIAAQPCHCCAGEVIETSTEPGALVFTV